MIMHQVHNVCHVNSCQNSIIYVAEDPNSIDNEDNVINYFTNFYLTFEHSTGNFWWICSTIQSHLMVKHRLDVSIVAQTFHKSYITAQKVDVFQKGVVQKVLREIDNNNRQEIADKIAICLLFFVSIADLRHYKCR